MNLPKSGCGGRLITTIPASVPEPFPVVPKPGCIVDLKSCHWYVLLYSECSCKDKNGFGSLIVVFVDVSTSTRLVSDATERNVDVIEDDVDEVVEAPT